MERDITLTPEQISLLLNIVQHDYDLQHYTPAETLSRVDQEVKDRYEDILRALQAH